ncbi:hypothetical protein PAAG_12439 [Paracoccidioides lutzii Pb01]|uniref:Uncharacterized protein n=1 Tax=Paracoccidioides lutzii (strain ATCC MYA-826 / Pb01) TaxID=502779 RepID=A0A0A2UZ90_PARBA|nr:hypothetical protein PAAG_12439 [Paracoccidioides lutzii Pb01]KGQ00896.1 hypothetical protein PAAG_12439 [Paracoccidioides lutzii Pb01]
MLVDEPERVCLTLSARTLISLLPFAKTSSANRCERALRLYSSHFSSNSRLRRERPMILRGWSYLLVGIILDITDTEVSRLSIENPCMQAMKANKKPWTEVTYAVPPFKHYLQAKTRRPSPKMKHIRNPKFKEIESHSWASLGKGKLKLGQTFLTSVRTVIFLHPGNIFIGAVIDYQ